MWIRKKVPHNEKMFSYWHMVIYDHILEGNVHIVKTGNAIASGETEDKALSLLWGATENLI